MALHGSCGGTMAPASCDDDGAARGSSLLCDNDGMACGFELAWGGTVDRRAHRHGTSWLSPHGAVPGMRVGHGGTIRHSTAEPPFRIVPRLTVPCLAVPVPCRAARFAKYSY